MKISVGVITYNQESTIRQTLDSILMQKGDFDLEIVIGEDCSMDNTRAICEEYTVHHTPYTIRLLPNTHNLGIMANFARVMKACTGDYVAICAGDDYWCDDHKLQKQMAYMEAHPEYGLVHTCIDLLYPHKLVRDKRTSMPEGDVFQLIGNYPIGNCSVVFKTELLEMIDFEEFQKQGLQSCDYVMYGIFASKAKFGFMPEHTAVWRRGIESVSGTADMEKQIRYIQNELAHWSYLAKLFPQRWSYSDAEGERYLHMSSFNIAFRFGNRKRALDEVKLMSKEDKKRYRLKILVAHSALLSFLWRKWKEV